MEGLTFQKGARLLTIRICLYVLALMVLASAAIVLWWRQGQAITEAAEWNSPSEAEKAPQGLVSAPAVEWNSPSEAEKALQGLISAPAAEWNSPSEAEKAPQGLVSDAEWNSPSETEKALQGLISAPEGAFQLQTGISNPRQASVYPFGVNVSLEQYGAADRERALAMIEAAGLRWVRQPFPWAEIEPQPGHYRWQPWDEIVSAVQGHDLSLIAVLDTSPSWARRDPESENPHTPPQETADYGRFVRALAERYGEQMDYYQVWDEPNVSAHWGDGYVDAVSYTALLREGYAQIKAADPVAYVLTAGLAPTTEAGPLNLNEVAFLRGLYAAGGRAYFDILAAKPYGFWSGPDDRREDVAVLNFSRLALLRRVMADEGDREKAVWAVEFGWNALPPDWAGRPSPWGTDSEELQAQRTVEAIQRARDEWPWLGVLLLPQFQPKACGERSRTAGDDDPRWGFALVDCDGEPRLLYRRIREVATAPPVAYAGTYPADHYTAQYQGAWRWSPLGADIGQDGDRLTIPFKGTRLDLTVRRGDFLGYFYITIDGQPANRLPRDDQGRSYLILHDPLYGTETVTLSAGLPDTTHEAVIVAQGGWGQWAIVGWTVAREASVWPYRVALSLIGLGGLLVLWRLLALVAIRGRRESVRSLLVACCSRLGDYAVGYRSLSGGLQLALTAIAAAVFYFSPWLPLSLLSLLCLAVLVWLRLDLGLALVAFCVPFFLQPKHILGRSFSMVEITTLLCFAAWALRWSVATIGDGGLKKEDCGPVGAIRGLLSLDGAVVFFVAVSAFSLLMAENFGVAMREFRVVVFESALFYFLLRGSALSKGQLGRVVDALVLAATLVALIGLYQYFFTADIITAEGVHRIRGLYGSPNNLSLFLDRVVPVLAAVVLFARQPWRRMAYALCSLPVLFCLYLTYSRGAWLLGLPAAALFIGLLRGGKALWISLAVIGVIALSLLPLVGTERFTSLLDTQGGTTFFRLKLWQASLNMIKDHPLFGVGLDNFLYQYRTRYVLPEAWQELDLSHPHNIVLDYWTRLGILGVAALIWLEGAFFAKGLRLYRRLPDKNERALVLGLMASMVACLAHGLIDNSYFLVDLAFVFFLTMGIIASMSAQDQGPFRGAK
jgi:O-antigen ligase